METSDDNSENAPLAFGLVVFAGLSTCIGAGFVFNTRLVKLASKRFLAGSLGFSAGVMLYLSLLEIVVKSRGAFEAYGESEAEAYLYATLSFFGGILFYKGIDYVVHVIGGDVGDHNVNIDLYDLNDASSARPRRNASALSAGEKAMAQASGNGQQQAQDRDVVVELNSGPVIRPSPDLHTLQLSLAGKVQQQHHAGTPVSALTPERKGDNGEALNVAEAGQPVQVGNDQKLVRMGLMTAVAIGIHNFPEGLATFVATLSDPTVGASLAVAIAIHNIPEGLCVAIPVYYATGNRWKAFGWALLSGISEPIGAAFAWIILKDIMSELVYGILFGLVAGLMVNVSIHELIPTAVRYDPVDKVTTNAVFAGMAVMAISLIIFKF